MNDSGDLPFSSQSIAMESVPGTQLVFNVAGLNGLWGTLVSHFLTIPMHLGLEDG